MSSIPLLLVIDDDFGSESEDRLYLRRQFCDRCGLRDVSNGMAKQGQANDFVADAVFCSAQTVAADGAYKNSIESALETVKQGWGPEVDRRWSLILLDRNFKPDERTDDIEFGYKVLDALVQAWPDQELAKGNCDIPIVMLTAKPNISRKSNTGQQD